MNRDQTPIPLSRHLLYKSRWVNLYVDEVRFPNGKIIARHHLLDFDHAAVMALAQDSAGHYLMVQVCRYPTGRAEWEFPAGSIEDGEGILEAARREVSEESGYELKQGKLLYSYNPMNGIANQVFHIVEGQAGERSGEFDAGEVSAVDWFSAEEIAEMIRGNAIRDGYTLTSFLLHRQFNYKY
jgi:8-oxo-dGTP pyrophosphatase MutT (NUDIX family)